MLLLPLLDDTENSMICAIKECEEKGVFSISKELNIQYQSIDPPILFCHGHFPEMLELYSIYKGLEQTQGFMCIQSSHLYWQDIIKQDGSTINFFIELLEVAVLALHFRRKFQSVLKESINKDGHMYWMSGIADGIINLRKFLLDHRQQIRKQFWVRKY